MPEEDNTYLKIYIFYFSIVHKISRNTREKIMYKTRNHLIFVSCKTVLRSKYRNHVLAWLTHIKFRKEARMAKE